MAEDLKINTQATKEEKYKAVLPQIEALVFGEESKVSNQANIAAALRQTFGFFWVGFYMAKGNELVLGPFQGDIACTRIGYGKGVCGASWAQKMTLIVPDVEEFPGHIACSSLSKSEIVVPIFNADNEIIGVLDVDSDKLNDFDEVDKLYLEKLLHSISKSI